MKLYAVTIAGRKYYFLGDLSPNMLNQVDVFCESISYKSDNAHKQQFDILIRYIKEELHQSVKPLRVERVFRIN